MKRLLVAAVVVLLLSMAGRPYASGFNPGAYPGVVTSGGTLVQSGVIAASTANYAACEFYNNTASSAYFIVYNSATVAGQSPSNIAGVCAASAGGLCSVSSGGPSGPAMNGGIVGGTGLSWYGSSSFPTQTGIGANGWMLCTVNIY